MKIEAADPEELLAGRVRAAIWADWPGVYVSNAHPQGKRAHVVTIQRAGGTLLGPVLDQARMRVNVYAPTDSEAADLARDVRLALNAQEGASPITRCSCTGPTVINSKGESPQLSMTCDALLIRRSRP